MNSGFWSAVLETCQQIQQVVAPRLLEWAGQSPSDRKADGSLVTRADLWADQKITEMLQERFPHHGCLSEEGNHTYGGEQWCWIIDPIDGTSNYSHGLPIWCIALSLLYQGTPVFGYVHVPGFQQTFHGFYQAPDHANGAYLNEKPIRVKVSEPTLQTFFSLCARSTNVLKHSFPCKIRMLGSASYNLLTVAAGYTLGAVERTPRIWDVAPAWPIVHAAGAHWQWLDPPEPWQRMFPIQPGHEAGSRIFHTLVSASPSLGQFFAAYII
ncbi:MAG TPA: inositol monophosphatase family protein [Thermosynechococcus sp. M98_K2018_005]|uniref:inositol monophosphatase family protein n=1 Tax=Thermosynechococcus sp. M98_K2018_005 TaxID=2747811 RepID=UPI0019E5CAFB|nr:inositol monophosphatase family protein [Thermosynechococcus sp. M98_K2018_005]HIK34354.1 inositol monophosphatase family protein [Thermosynechococcus sp. M98_K2018_005]